MEAIGVCITKGKSEVLLRTVSKSPGGACDDGDIIELLSFEHKTISAGDLNAKHPFWNIVLSNPSGKKLMPYLT